MSCFLLVRINEPGLSSYTTLTDSVLLHEKNVTHGKIATDQASRGIGPYSQGLKALGFIFVSGQLGLDSIRSELVEGGIEAQTQRALTNLGAILEAGHSGRDNVVRCTICVADMADFETVNHIYEHFVGDPAPTRVAVGVKSLPRNALIEIEAVAIGNDPVPDGAKTGRRAGFRAWN